MLELDLDFYPKKSVAKGDLLIAEPFMQDAHFGRRVVLICEHKDDEGSFGLILNRPTQYSVGAATQTDALYDEHLFEGGPVEVNTLHFIHTFADLENSIQLKDNLYWGGNFNELKKLAIQGLVNAQNCRFFMGYSGWGKLQLKQELATKSWIVADTPLDDIFHISPDHLWKEKLKEMGGKYKIFSNYPSNPSLN